MSTLSAVLCRAESVSLTHNFNDMKNAGTLTWTGTPTDYTVGYTDLVTYTGGSGGTFSMDASRICISLPSKNSTFITSPAVPSLSAVRFIHTKGASPTWIKIYVSFDGSEWTDVSSYASYSSSQIDLVLPEAGDYYIKILNNGTSSPAQPVNFLSYRYTYDPTPCNCFRYIAP